MAETSLCVMGNPALHVYQHIVHVTMYSTSYPGIGKAVFMATLLLLGRDPSGSIGVHSLALELHTIYSWGTIPSRAIEGNSIAN